MFKFLVALVAVVACLALADKSSAVYAQGCTGGSCDVSRASRAPVLHRDGERHRLFHRQLFQRPVLRRTCR